VSQAIPTQHPAVVLRSHYVHLRTMLAVAVIAVAGLSAAVVVLALDDDAVTSVSVPATHVAAAGPNGSVRYDGGPEEGTRAIVTTIPAGTRYDGGPDEGTRGIVTAPAAGTRYDGGPDEGTRGPGH
jgi:hypothetical protein